uniref:Putative secreted protein ovary overexpressed n=1 Tax=Rhipicephalus microplus TaxID=6941 RepID=A0A6M2DAY6_RHIMP
MHVYCFRQQRARPMLQAIAFILQAITSFGSPPFLWPHFSPCSSAAMKCRWCFEDAKNTFLCNDISFAFVVYSHKLSQSW